MPAADFAKYEKPDELIEAAWSSGVDKKAIIRAGSDAARFLTAGGEGKTIVELFWPAPRPLEAVDLWSENDRSAISQGIRPHASAVVPGCVLGYFIARFLFGRHVSETSTFVAEVGIIIASIVVLGLLFKLLINMTLRRRAARLDENSALTIVLDQLRRGTVARPKLVPFAVKGMRDYLAAFAAAQRKA